MLLKNEGLVGEGVKKTDRLFSVVLVTERKHETQELLAEHNEKHLYCEYDQELTQVAHRLWSHHPGKYSKADGNGVSNLL